MIVTRFAPSPNGLLHLGHAYSAIVAHDLAQEAGGRFLLRIEDIDGARSKPELTEEFRQDLRWLGLSFEEVPMQSARLASYQQAADRLKAMGLLYPCVCTRSEIAAAAVQTGPEGPVYPGTCKGRTIDPGQSAAWRLDVAAARKLIGTASSGPLKWNDSLAGEQIAQPELLGDAVLVRKDNPASYHLAATLDDAADGVTLVARGQDLFSATHIHSLLQTVLDLPVPRWHHHNLIVDEAGQKLAKRRGSQSLADLREAGADGAKIATDIRLGRLPIGMSLSKG